jgi:hypothetical protein
MTRPKGSGLEISQGKWSTQTHFPCEKEGLWPMLVCKDKKWNGWETSQGKGSIQTHSLCEKKMCGNVRGSPQNSHTQIFEVCSHSSNFEMLNNYFGKRFEGSDLDQIGHFLKVLKRIYLKEGHIFSWKSKIQIMAKWMFGSQFVPNKPICKYPTLDLVNYPSHFSISNQY